MSDPVDLTIVVPLYDEGATLGASLRSLADAADASPWRWEMVLVDDGSHDDSRAIGDAFAAERGAHVRTAHHAANRGRGAAVKTGLHEARGTFAGFLDIDLEVGAEALAPCVQALVDGADVAIGDRRYELAARSWLRHVLSRGYAFLVRGLLATRVRDTESGCKWFRVDAVRPLLDLAPSDGWFFDTEIMIAAERAGLAIAQVPVVFRRRFDKQSTVRPLADAIDYWRHLIALRRRLAGTPRVLRGRDDQAGDD